MAFGQLPNSPGKLPGLGTASSPTVPAVLIQNCVAALPQYWSVNGSERTPVAANDWFCSTVVAPPSEQASTNGCGDGLVSVYPPHPPARHCCPLWHCLPHCPQLFGSVRTSMHLPLHALLPG